MPQGSLDLLPVSEWLTFERAVATQQPTPEELESRVSWLLALVLLLLLLLMPVLRVLLLQLQLVLGRVCLSSSNKS